MYPIKDLKIIFLVIASSLALNSNAQTVNVHAHNEALNKVFIELGSTYNIQFSFNDKLLSSYSISDSSSYSSPKEAISKLLGQTDLKYKIVSQVFIIYKDNKDESPKPSKHFYFSGRVGNRTTGEALPFTNIKTNTNGLVSDQNGNFSIKSKDSIQVLHISYVGYHNLDTSIAAGSHHRISLQPSIIGLNEVTVSPIKEKNTRRFSDEAGLIKLNPQVSGLLSGNNNAVLSVLRLQPGVMAAGEQTKDYILWGSYKGQTEVLFDGISLFNINCFNDNIGVINPLMIQDIEVKKGGYNADIGSRVGGLVNITGKTGEFGKYKGEVDLNNQLASVKLNIPLGEKLCLQSSYRNSYNLFDWNNTLSDEYQKGAETYKSDYKFNDLNIKISGKNDKGNQYYISMLGNHDISSFQYDTKEIDKEYHSESETQKLQMGAALFYSKKWAKLGISNATVSYSSLGTEIDNSLTYKDLNDNLNSIKNHTAHSNSISEQSIKLDHILPTAKKHGFKIGLAFINNTSSFLQDTADITLKDFSRSSSRFNAYVNDLITINKVISIQPGLKIDFPLYTQKPYFQPRISTIIKPYKALKINIGTGLYNQFISENTILDQYSNQLYYWDVNSSLSSFHNVLGLSYPFKYFNIKIESFYKFTSGITRFISDSDSKLSSFEGIARNIGIDFYIDWKIMKHNFWVAYTISKTEEYFSYFKTDTYQRAPHDQRHELKAAGMLNLKPFYFSTNYVFGSGMPNTITQTKIESIKPYHRMDIAFLYKFKIKQFNLETGFSILNVLNTKNIKYDNFSNFPNGKTIYSQALPFTPNILLKIKF